jgi:hypothetical protein
LSTESPEEIADSEASPIDVPEVTAAREWLDDGEDDSPEGPRDILDIIKVCLKDVKKLKTTHSINVVTQLTAVAEYVKLQDKYQNHPKCTRPCLNASLAIARCMGKGQYFARQIRQNEAYLLVHGRLPPSKESAHHGQYTLLDNEAVLHGVRRYLAAQNLGSITPQLLCRHVNKVIIPALDLTEKKSSISERTAINWLKKLGYTCKDVKKGVYFDGHERPDVVEARKKFLAEIAKYERRVNFKLTELKNKSNCLPQSSGSCVNMMTQPWSRFRLSLHLGRRNMSFCLKMKVL